MVSLALAAALAAAQSWQPQSGVTSQATATVRIVAAERIRFDNPWRGRSAQPAFRETEVRIDGARIPARLVEFP